MPLPGHSSILSISTRKKLHPGVPPTTTREAVCRSSGKTRHGAYLEYTHNIVIQHQDEDPTGFVRPMFTKDSKPLGKEEKITRVPRDYDNRTHLKKVSPGRSLHIGMK
ncbi:hypothetical protein TNCV_3282761 [Trichonephila clavipes]|nr:hypothetical protein TNCV_3282761 [Trichonephila clavipes]